MFDTYERTPLTQSRPKVQRAIIADILLNADAPLSFDNIVAQARDAHYEETFKRGTQVVTIEESIRFHLDLMEKAGTVKRRTSKA